MILPLLITGVVGGFLSGFFGVGGGIIMVPLLMMWAKFDQRRASATSLLAIVPTSFVGALTYAANHQVDVLVAVFVSLGAIVGAPLGSKLLRVLPIAVVHWTFITMMVIEAIRLIFITEVSHGAFELTFVSGAGLIGLGLLMGVASGMLGIGGGVIAVPVFMSVFGLAPLLAKGTSLLAMVPTAISGTIPNLRAGLVVLKEGAIVGLAAVAASFGGVALAFLLPAQLSAQLFGLLLLGVAIQSSVRRLNRK
ncbi:sulfite exporter TauE/SafE family protein [Aurantimicrobium minutum]|uniref:sulfite exporter TauE/SafE family protein n=1 Tax=Aurantimicrobium minutum TaxID=708131 RepID=UPI0024750280|nr:sulfite exporter TauE/SafE family protein [Aurantimicrobium minutum]MDH6423327.1 putative membrane protein YfcA [Aurantimicrobium minutum]